jgi:DNA-binding MltR family transcriptional regulator
MKTRNLETADPKVQKAIVESDDRSVVLVGSAILERKLDDLIEKAVVSPAAVDKLLGRTGRGGALGSFFSKIQAAWAFGLISEDEYADLELIREIRNGFAHDVLDCDFNSQDARSKCDRLSIAWRALGTRSLAHRVAFNMEIYTLALLLTQRAQRVTPRTSPARIPLNGR